MNKGGQAWPPKLGSNKLACFKITWVASDGMIMASMKDGTTEVQVGGNVDAAFKGEEAIDVLPVGEVRAKGRRDRTVQGLESLEGEGIGGWGRGNVWAKGRIDDVDEKRRRKKSDVIIIMVGRREKIWMSREGVGASKVRSRDVDEVEVEVRKD